MYENSIGEKYLDDLQQKQLWDCYNMADVVRPDFISFHTPILDRMLLVILKTLIDGFRCA